jgi:HSP20 family protein
MAQSTPFEDVEKLFERFDRQFEAGGLTPFREVDVDVVDREDSYVVAADLPGFEKSDVDASLSDRRLTVSAERSEGSEESEGRYLRRERSRDSVSRTVVLPDAVVADEASATYENGVLTVTLPKVAAVADAEGTSVEVE